MTGEKVAWAGDGKNPMIDKGRQAVPARQQECGELGAGSSGRPSWLEDNGEWVRRWVLRTLNGLQPGSEDCSSRALGRKRVSMRSS